MSASLLLTGLVAVPWLGALLLGIGGSLPARAARALAVLASASTLVFGVLLLARFDPALPGLFVEQRVPWIRSLGIDYHLGLDGMGLLFVLLTGVLGPLALVTTLRRATRVRAAGAWFLILQGSALGVFVALDFFPWFICWELSLVPAFFLIRGWGGANAGAASYRFVVFTLAGSAGLLLAFAALYAATGTMNFTDLARLRAAGELAGHLGALGAWATALAFLGVLVGLGVKAPLFPFHSWMPATYAEAPAGVSMFLTGVMSKMGVYGFFRLLWPIFPEELRAHAGPLLVMALGGVVFGALAALRSGNLRHMLAYSSLNHVSYCLLALFAVAGAGPADGVAVEAALAGALLQAFNHGLSAAALFCVAGILEQRSGGNSDFARFGGVRNAAPRFALLAGVALFSSLGLPGLNGFVGEFLIFRGVFALQPVVAAVATVALLVTAIFLLSFWQRVFHGPRAGAVAGEFADLDAAEWRVLGPLVFLMILLGVAPQLLAGLINPLATSWAASLTLP
jgi:NADH-quinone oxidoreductase subunit M